MINSEQSILVAILSETKFYSISHHYKHTFFADIILQKIFLYALIVGFILLNFFIQDF